MWAHGQAQAAGSALRREPALGALALADPPVGAGLDLAEVGVLLLGQEQLAAGGQAHGAVRLRRRAAADPLAAIGQGQAQADLGDLRLARVEGEDHGVLQAHEGLSGEGVDAHHEAQGPVAGVVVHRRPLLQGAPAG